MTRFLSSFIILIFVGESLVSACLITNCPRGGKRSGNLVENTMKRCVSCGPDHRGQCFGPNICCGPFGCLMGTSETLRCQQHGFFHEPEPCIAGNASCRRNTGRCAFDGICCNQDACFSDETCASDNKYRGFPKNSIDIYNLIKYQDESTIDNNKSSMSDLF